jgi:hypothetical protein
MRPPIRLPARGHPPARLQLSDVHARCQDAVRMASAQKHLPPCTRKEGVDYILNLALGLDEPATPDPVGGIISSH